MADILVIHGPNLNLLGTREVDVYGKTTLAEINKAMKKQAAGAGHKIDFFQSNHEGEIVDAIQKAECDVILINPAAFTHYSVAVRDAVASVGIPAIEIHLSNIYAREEFRQESLIAPVATGVVAGFGPKSYYLALEAAIEMLGRKKRR